MTISSLLTLMGIWLAALVSPGPDIVQVIRVAPRSTRAGLMCAVGVFSGTVFWIVASLAGLSALIAARPSVLSICNCSVACSCSTWGYPPCAAA